MVLLKTKSVGVVCANMGDFQRWVTNQTVDSDIRHFPITTVEQAGRKYDEYIITVTAVTNSSYYDIYVKLNGAYNGARRERKAV